MNVQKNKSKDKLAFQKLIAALELFYSSEKLLPGN
jgi:hypothetical protein